MSDGMSGPLYDEGAADALLNAQRVRWRDEETGQIEQTEREMPLLFVDEDSGPWQVGTATYGHDDVSD